MVSASASVRIAAGAKIVVDRELEWLADVGMLFCTMVTADAFSNRQACLNKSRQCYFALLISPLCRLSEYFSIASVKIDAFTLSLTLL